MTECPECGLAELEPRLVIEENEPVEDGLTCPECDAEFEDDTVLDWDEVDWPVWIHWESYNDSWDMWRNFLRETGLHEEAAPSSAHSDMKYTVFSVYFRIDEDGSVNGPFAAKGDEQTIYEK